MKSLIFGFNYERRGVTYKFPPIKLEYKIMLDLPLTILTFNLNMKMNF